ncbi:glycosyltransferase [Pedobacter sp.]|uniref:glycosyltransferase n=1 Tax=Pedobacter sp. TaxID=1411316 RepID=UPI003D7F629D
MASIKKVILFFPFNLLAHYLRSLVLADSYSKDEYTIYFLSSPTYNNFVKAHGYQTFDCLQFDADYVMQCSRKFDFSWLNKTDLEQVLLSQVTVLKDLKADIAIGDVAPTLKMATALTGVTHISLLNGYMTRYYQYTRTISKTHKAFPFINLLPDPIAAPLVNLGEKLAFKQIQKTFNELRKKYGLESLPDYLHEIEGNLNYICDLPTLFPQQQLPSTFKFIGPLCYHYKEKDLNWLEEIPTAKPIICVSLGSTGDWEKLAFLNDAYYSRYTIVTAGDKKKYLSASHIIARDFVNLDSVLQKAQLLICHGGNGTIYHGIMNGVFMLCTSTNFEQEWNISAMERNGYGLSADHFTASKWKTQIAARCSDYDNQLAKGQ